MDSKDARELFFAGLDCLDAENYAGAEVYLKKSLALSPQRKSTLVNLSISCLRQSKLEEAYSYAVEATSVDDRDHNVLNQLAAVLVEMKRAQDALDVVAEILESDPDYLDAIINRAKALYVLARYEEAIDSYNNALSLDETVTEAITGIIDSLRRFKKMDAALSVYEKASVAKPNNPLLLNAAGVLLQECRRYQDALLVLNKALEIKPDYSEAFNSRGNLFFILGKNAAALDDYNQAIALKQNFSEAHYNKGNVLSNQKDYVAAISSYMRASEIDPNSEFLRGSILHAKMQCCDWDSFDDEISVLVDEARNGKCVVTPFTLLGLIDSPLDQLEYAKAYSAHQRLTSGVDSVLQRKSKIRIGYVSSDFREHAVAHLIREVIELHDRARFSVVGFSLLADNNSATREKIKSLFDRFHDCQLLDDRQIQALIKSEEIDILIDLNGYTAHCRTDIFAGRPAPVQVNYLGYPGTMGASFMDYIIADTILVPCENREFYSEKIVYMPHSYQPNDTQREISGRVFSRAELDLPEHGFIFCCFNNNFKLTPSVFDSWMRILCSVEDSILWIFEDNPLALENLRLEAQARGVSAGRIKGACRLPVSEHLARHRCADLFLDTFPYNAHTTASDALWAGLPVLTRRGETFAGRVAASVLTAIGLPELVVTTEAEYEATAIRLAKDPDELAILRKRLADNKDTSKLFDTPVYVRHLEAAFGVMYERCHAGLPPDHIYVEA